MKTKKFQFFILLVLIILGVLLIVNNFSNKLISARAIYDPESKKATFKFTKGWNAYPILTGDNIDNNCNLPSEKGGSLETIPYLYSPISNKYLMIGGDTGKKIDNEQKQYGKEGKQYLYPFGAWFYFATKDCKAGIVYEQGGMNPFIEIIKGWQLVSKLPWMNNAATLFGECDVEKFNQFDNTNKNWKYSPSKTSKEELISLFDSVEVGEVFMIKFADDCSLGYSIEEVVEATVGVEGGPPALE